MSKRPAPTFNAQEMEEMMQEAKRMATTYQCKEMLDAARHHKQKEMIQASRPPPKCGICRQDHFARECNRPVKEKIEILKQKKMCLLCLTKDKHLPIHCKTLNFTKNLCNNKICGKNYSFHHASICPLESAVSPNLSPLAEPMRQDESLDYN